MALAHLPASKHAALTESLDGIWTVKGDLKMPMLMPMRISRTMTVVRRADGELVVFNSMRLSAQGLAQLATLGPVKHVVRLGGFHGRDDAFFKEHFGATVYALPGMEYRRGIGKKLGDIYFEPDVRLSSAADLPLTNATLHVIESSNPPEGIVIAPLHGGVAFASDALQHTPAPDEFHSLVARVMMKRMGFMKPHAVGAGWLQFAKPRAADVRKLSELSFEHLFSGHGDPVIGNASMKYQPALAGELKGCHA